MSDNEIDFDMDDDSDWNDENQEVDEDW